MEKTYPLSELTALTESVFEAMGCSPADARLAAGVLLAADLRGVDSHGVARLSGYVRLWEKGRINTRPNIRVVHGTPSTATVDADGALGLVAGPFAMQLAIEKAGNVGTGWVAVKNSNHFGIAGQHAMMALQHQMIGIAMTNASPLVAPTFSKERMLGTNPIAVAVPAGQEPPIVADFATSAAANGKLEMLQRKGNPAPEGWIQDANGLPVTDAYGLKQGGALLPLGSTRENGSHKGYCLGAVVDILSAVLPGAGYGPWAPPFVDFLPLPPDPVGPGLGHFFGAMRVDAFRPVEDFTENMDRWLRRFRGASPVEGQEKTLVPGDPEREAECHRKKHGIPLLPPVVEDLKTICKKFLLKGLFID